ncbi:MAG: 5-(carboxyamino)imidazole ribonucleotide mutase [Candidatus Omnitrophica bacterium 4484_213]|nr:MAG: 5-(carboxyamino)imidazole ribonucleotide mutase [Candidatus Omnitrophica bacterium 4484_213]
MKNPIVSIIIGSDSDLPTIRETEKLLKKFGIAYELKILSAHRSPKKVSEFALGAAKRGIKIVIAGAGGAAALGGAIAARTTLPVIAIPIETKSLKGLDSLLSTVQMPSGVPVGCMAIGKTGAKNAAIFAAQILGIENKVIAEKIQRYKRGLSKKVEQKDKNIKT